MKYGDIIKRAWSITWRYKALWVLGLFAGVSGCQGNVGSPGGSGGGNGEWSEFSDWGTGGMPGMPDLERYIPIVLVGALILFAVWLVWVLLGVGARAGLIHAVNEIEQGRTVRLRDAWSAGFHHFWPVLGLAVLLALPMVVVGGAMLLAIVVPLVGSLAAGRDPGLELIAPMCGGVLIGVLLLSVATFFLGILHLMAMRYIVLGNRGVFDSLRAAWAALRNRFKEHLLIWLINWGLNVAASIAISIPIVVVWVVAILPGILSARDGNWGALAGTIAVAVIITMILSLLYTAIWGVFTSALWTVFFRKLTGMEPLAEPVAAVQPPLYEPQPPAAPEQQMAPPVAPQPEGPQPPQSPPVLPDDDR